MFQETSRETRNCSYLHLLLIVIEGYLGMIEALKKIYGKGFFDKSYGCEYIEHTGGFIMRVSWKWLKELVDLNMTAEEAAARLTEAGLEVEGLDPLDKGIQHVVTGKILEVLPHPEAKKLVVTKVDAGQDKSAADPRVVAARADVDLVAGQDAPGQVGGDGREVEVAGVDPDHDAGLGA